MIKIRRKGDTAINSTEIKQLKGNAITRKSCWKKTHTIKTDSGRNKKSEQISNKEIELVIDNLPGKKFLVQMA